MKIRLIVGRYAADRRLEGQLGPAYPPPYADKPTKTYQNFDIDVHDEAMVLDGLIHIREYVDETLCVRCSCRCAICGSCAMWVNGHAKLACTTKLKDVIENGAVRVESPPSMMPVRDLVWDMGPFMQKMRAVKPWLEGKPVAGNEEYRVPNEAMDELVQEVSCISCGACLMDCESYAVNQNFLGPHALARAYRYAADPRDSSTQARLKEYSEPNGVWDCTHCYECVTVCPKGVAPLDQILKIRKMAVEAGYTNNTGTRHAVAFAQSVRDSGRLNELTLLPKSLGLFNVVAQLQTLPSAFNLIRAGKLPPIIHHKIPGATRIKAIFKKVGGTLT
jgi:succinate dehydrogenase / fumarate reductase iron-sulfur subunit